MTISFRISIPTDEGFLGRECINPRCRRYFRVRSQSIKSRMYCPYCGGQFPNDHLHTGSQVKYIERAGQEKALEYAYGEIDKMFGKIARGFSGRKGIRLDHRPTRYRAKTVFPNYRERRVDSELTCPNCSFCFQVYGIFGLCPGCRAENTLIYDANINIIRNEIEQKDNPDRALRHAYSDLVSTFQTFCARKACHLSGDKPSCQELFATRKFFKQATGVDILAVLDQSQLLALRRVFHKRHVCQHANGIATERYVKRVPEEAALLGTRVPLSMQEFEDAAVALRRILDELVRAVARKTPDKNPA